MFFHLGDGLLPGGPLLAEVDDDLRAARNLAGARGKAM